MSRIRRGPRTRESLQRKQPRFSGDLMLIVCEGAKTEPIYFKDLKQRLKIHSLQVDVYGKECGTDPLSVVEYAKDMKKKPRKDGLLYDRVWCVVDEDNHTTLKHAQDMARANKIGVCLSVPSFEFWYLLHFIYTTKPFEDSDAVIHELEKYLKNHTYLKNSPPMDELMPVLETAIRNAEKVRKNKHRTGQDNPGTDVDLLVSELKKIGNKR